MPVTKTMCAYGRRLSTDSALEVTAATPPSLHPTASAFPVGAIASAVMGCGSALRLPTHAHLSAFFLKTNTWPRPLMFAPT